MITSREIPCLWPLLLIGLLLGTPSPTWSTMMDGVWEELSPPDRVAHTAVYDPPEQRMVIFGGGSGVWEFTLGANPHWARLRTFGTSPSARTNHTAVYDPIHRRMIVFGGDSYGEYKNDVWALSLTDPPTWTQLTPAGAPPSGRRGHSAVYDASRDQMLVFGGFGPGWQNDTWTLSLSGTPTWTQLAVPGGLPAGRWDHSAIYDPVRDRMVIFGGYSGASPSFTFNDVWALGLSGSPSWTQLAPTGSQPAKRSEHSAIYDPGGDRMIVLGGTEVWALSLVGNTSWTLLAPADPLPFSASDHTAIHDAGSDRMVVQIGYRVWALTLSGNPAWIRLGPNDLPRARGGHTANVDDTRQRVVVFGGYGPVSALNDVWLLPLAGHSEWSPLMPAGTPPGPRYSHTAIYDPIRDRLVVFGGYDYGSQGVFPLNDTWALSFAGVPTWSRLFPQGTPPDPRGAHTAIYDRVSDRMIVFGGSSYDGAAWALTLAEPPAWTRLPDTGARRSHSAIYDPLRQRMLVFGGYICTTLACEIPFYFWDVQALSLGSDPGWSQFATTGPLPPRREDASAIYASPDRIVSFGGDAGMLWGGNEVWALPLEGDPAWVRLAPEGELPPPRFGHATVYDPVRNRMILFSGAGRNDTWQLSWDVPVPVALALLSAQVSPGRVALAWSSAGLAGLAGWVDRREEQQPWVRIGMMTADGMGVFRYEDQAVRPGARYAYRMGCRAAGEDRSSEEHWVEVPRLELSLTGMQPNPAAGGSCMVVFTLPSREPARLEIFDVQGRRVLAQDVGDFGPGPHQIRVGDTNDLDPGVYVFRLTASSRVLTRRGVVLR